ncbi:Putative HAD-hydrolase yfnB [Kurthia zopfii]|nr:Putative HAD-hydrolase yfnB [Kurthia zopfii]
MLKIVKYHTLIFDLDDTLLDFQQAEIEAFEKTFSNYNIQNSISTYKKDYDAISRVLWDGVQDGIFTIAQVGEYRFKRLFEKHKLDLEAVSFNKDYLFNLGQQSNLIEGAEQIATTLPNIKFVALSNGFTKTQLSRIANSPLKDLFDEIIISEMTGFEKPQKGIFDYTMNQLSLSETDGVLMIGDSLSSDIAGGLNYGMDTCWFNPHRKTNESFVTPTYEIKSLDEIADLVKK